MVSEDRKEKFKKLIYKLIIGFIYIIFSIATWDAFEIIVFTILQKFNADTLFNRLIVFIITAIITLSIIVFTQNLDLLADSPKVPTIFGKLKQIFIGMALIILWIAIWDSFEILTDMGLHGRDTDRNRLLFYFFITVITLYIIIDQSQLDLLVWS